jgi:hypothetical protein
MYEATAHQSNAKAPGAPLSRVDEVRRMLQQAVEVEVVEYIEAYSH